MRRALTALIILLAGSAAAAGQKEDRITLQGEYRRDAVDYEDAPREFFRERATLRFSRESAFMAALVHGPGGGESFTWNLTLGDLSPDMSFMAGHFYAHFGKGLLAGKRSAWEPDVFSRRGAISDEGVFTPCKSGNPNFAFHGAAASFRLAGEDLSLSLHPFYSLKERYITQEDYENRTTSSLSAIESRDGRERQYLEPVDVHTRGAMLALSCIDLLSARAYWIGGNTTAPGGDEVSTGGLRGFTGRGFTLEYRDDSLALFCEWAMASSRYQGDDGGSSSSEGGGYLTGASLTSPLVRASFIYKNADDNYHSPYTATMGEYLGTGTFIDISLNPLKGLSLGASCSSERRANTGSADDEQTVAERERLFISWMRGWLEEARSELGISRRSDEGSGERRRWRQKIALRPAPFLSLGASATIQTTEGMDATRAVTVALGLHRGRAASVALSYTRARVAESNPVYESLLPLKNASMTGTFIRESGDVAAGRATLAWQGLYVSGRVFHQRYAGGGKNTLLELYASGSW